MNVPVVAPVYVCLSVFSSFLSFSSFSVCFCLVPCLYLFFCLSNSVYLLTVLQSRHAALCTFLVDAQLSMMLAAMRGLMRELVGNCDSCSSDTAVSLALFF